MWLSKPRKIKNAAVALMDTLVIFTGFFALTVIFHNYGSDAYKLVFGGPLPLAGIALAAWLTLGYTAELYAPHPLLGQTGLKKSFILTSAIWLIITSGFSYNLFLEAPGKTAATLIGSLMLLAAARILWHELGEKIFFKKKIIFLGENRALQEIAAYLAHHTESNFILAANISGGVADPLYPRLNLIFEKEKSYVIVAAEDMKISDLVLAGHPVISAGDFYAEIFQKVYLENVSEEWVLKNTVKPTTFSGRSCEYIVRLLALITLILLLPLLALIYLAIIFTSPGPAFINQVRVGLFGRTFILHKFRSMRADAERAGAQWAAADDTRVTPLGRVLRATHLDELPQLWNIALGELAFIGPRPERPELIAPIKKEVPLFDLRLLAKPGITGWAQINYHYGRSIDDAREKLAYDLYYLKNRNLWLDVKIILRTLKHFIA